MIELKTFGHEWILSLEFVDKGRGTACARFVKFVERRLEEPECGIGSVDDSIFASAVAYEQITFYATLRFAVDGFNKLKLNANGESDPKVFIAGGNALSVLPPKDRWLTLGLGKVRNK